MTSKLNLGPDGEIPVALLDSQRFGCKIGRVMLEDPNDAAELAERFSTSDLEILVVRYAASDLGVFGQLLSDDFDVIHADSLCFFRGELPGAPPAVPLEGFVVEGPTETSEELRLAVTEIFSGYQNHYSSNSRVDADRVVEGYCEWVDSHFSSDGQRVVVLRHSGSGQIAAVAAFSTGDSVASINLAGVVSTYRRAGLYQRLLSEVERVASGDGCECVEISTQLGNLAAIRSWARRGWMPVAAFQTVHLVRPGHNRLANHRSMSAGDVLASEEFCD